MWASSLWPIALGNSTHYKISKLQRIWSLNARKLKVIFSNLNNYTKTSENLIFFLISKVDTWLARKFMFDFPKCLKVKFYYFAFDAKNLNACTTLHLICFSSITFLVQFLLFWAQRNTKPFHKKKYFRISTGSIENARIDKNCIIAHHVCDFHTLTREIKSTGRKLIEKWKSY